MSQRISWSVAMCTFNGARHVREQLASITAQTIRPDEIVVVDDASDDETPTIVGEFDGVRLIRHDTNRGSNASFEEAIAATTGDLVALADQDDVWRRDKLEVLQSGFDDPQVSLIFSGATLIDDEGRPLPGTAWHSPRVGFDLTAYADADLLQFHLEHSVVTGATVAFRGWVRHAALPFPPLVGPRAVPWKLHDGWLTLVATLASDVGAEIEPLISYRLHAAQQVGLAADGTVVTQTHHERLAFRREVSGLLLDRARTLTDPPARPAILARLEDEVAHLDARLAAGDRIRRVATEWRRGGYARWSGGWRGAVRDLAGL